MSERGSSLLFVVVAMMFASVSVAVVLEIGVVLTNRAQAQTAADAAALAGAAADDAAVHELAVSNRATVESIVRVGNVIEVRVRVGRVTATARAERILEICRAGRQCERLFSP